MKVFTNGCFDILHRGHLELLKYCSELACPVGRHAKEIRQAMHGRVTVGLNSDDSIKRLKGKGRPVNNQEDRKIFLNSLLFVDEVIIFEEDSPTRLIRELDPDLVVKGSSSVIDQREFAGYRLKIFNQVGEYSTTNIIDEILSNRR